MYVAFENGITFFLGQDGTIRREQGKPSIVIVKELTREKLQDYAKRGLKVFPCDEEEKECLSKVLNKVYPECKSCKFA
ncbi:hypothetical protein [Metallosphaera hakonensis]|nr:hypothetical protein [Metallosphaera hakonensis]